MSRFIFKSLVIENFMPFRKAVELPLDDQGLVFIRGENKISQSLNANGVGKTSILDALTWALYGVTTKGLKADAVRCRFAGARSRTTVELKFSPDSGARVWTLTRCRPHRLTLTDGKELWTGEEAQAVLSTVFPVGLRTFLNSVIFGQGAFERFALADTAEKMRMLDEIYGLDFSKARKAAAEKQAAFDKEFSALRNKIEVAKEKLELERESAKTVEESLRMWEQRQREQLEAAKEDLEKTTARLEDVRQEIAAARKETKRLEQLAALQNVQQRLLDGLREAENYGKREVQEASRRVKEAEDRLERARNRLAELAKKGICPTCRQVVVGSHLEKAYKKELSQYEDEVKQARQELESVSKKAARDVKKLKTEFTRSVKEAGKDLTDEILDIPDCSYLEYQLSELMEKKSKLEQRIKELSKVSPDSEVTKLRQTLARKRENARNLEVEIKGLTNQANKLEKSMSLCAYWKEAFGDRGIRSFLFESVADYLNARIAHHLGYLAPGEVKVWLTPTVPKKSGGESIRVTVNVEWAWGASSYNAESNGQDRRVDLAIFLALQDLALSSVTTSVAFRCFDQPEDGLDSQGLARFGDWIESEAKGKDKGTTLLISHNSDLADVISPDKIWTVVMGKDGATITQET